MSDYITAARPYARAAFEHAQAKKQLVEWSEYLAFMSVAAEHDAVQNLFDNPKLTKAERAEAFIDICSDKINDDCKNLLMLLAENGRLAILPAIAEQYEIYKAEAESTVDATIVSAHKVSDEQVSKISKALEKRLGKKVSLSSEVDEALIGGAVIKAGDTVIDGSIRGRVDKLAVTLLR